MKKILSLFAGMFLFSGVSFSQVCSITISPMDTTICPGDSVHIVATANLINANQAFNFNGSSLPSGWTAGGSTMFNSPCGPSPDGTPYYWASTSTGVPNITTADFDVSCGGTISFQFIYSVQGGATPCEGPDQMNEGMAVQYSTNGGVTWTTIEYYVPDGTTTTSILTSTTSVAFGATPFTVWNYKVITIPAGAMTTSTRFRWFQQNSSGSCCDNWGLDEILINATGAPCGATAVLDWSNGMGDTTNYWVVPYGDTTFTCDVYDTNGTYMCSSLPVNVHLYTNVLSYNLSDFAYSFCPTTEPPAQVTNIVGAIPPYSVNWTELNSTANPVNLPTGGAEHDTIVYHVVIKDGCDFQKLDSITLIVNKKLNIDSLNVIDASSCNPDGVVMAFVSGITAVSGQPIYKWNGPGATNPAFINSTVWTNRAPGWYYFLVTDDVCTDFDSVQVSITNPPIAIINPSATSGCAPASINFVNGSQNADHFKWDLGTGTYVNVNDFTTQSGTFNNNTTIYLIAFDATNCSDTTSVTITIDHCGCTDKLAINYDPNAVADDGSCQFPMPEFVIPNIFTPNNDGDNDYLEFIVTNYSNIEFTVNNRWGNKIFEGSGLNPKWDGKINGNNATEGVYFVKYKITSLKGDQTFEGQTPVQLVR